MSRWQEVPLGNVVELAYGKSLPVRSRQQVGSIPVYGSNGVVGYHDTPLINDPTIVVGRKGAAGSIHLVEQPSFPIDTTFFVRVKNGHQIDLRYLTTAMRRADLKRLAITTGVPGLNRDDAYRQTIPLPPLDEQRRIVGVLDGAARIVRLRRRALETARAVVPALFLDTFGDPATNPKGWEVATLQQALKHLTSGSRGWAHYYADTGAKFIRVQNLTGNALSTKDIAFVNPPASAEATRTRVEIGDVLLAITGSPGLTAVVDSDVGEAHVNQHVALLRCNPNTVNPYYLYGCLTAPSTQFAIGSSAYGQTRSGLGFAEVRRLKIPVPPIEQQQTFAAHVADLRTVVARQERALAAAEGLQGALMARVFG